jgi:hypothetical protein
MNRLAKILIAGTAALILPTAQAFADGSISAAYAGGVGGVGNINLSGAGALNVVVPGASTDNGNGTSSHAGGNPGGTVDQDSGTAGGTTASSYRPGATADASAGATTGSGSTAGSGSTTTGGDTSESDIYNNQVNLNTVWNNTNVTVDDVNGDVNGSAAATANAFQAVTFNNTVVNNNQYASGEAVGSDLNAQVTNINGSVNMSNVVACNTADVSTDPAYTVVHSTQECAVGDPSQATNVFAAQVQNDVNVSGAVAANVYTEDTNANYNYVNTNQINHSAVNSTTNVSAYNVGGSVNVSSSAVGNTAQIVHY